MAKLIRSLASGNDRDLSPETVPGISPFHARRAAKRLTKKGPSKFSRTTRVVLASEVHKAFKGKRSTARARRALVRALEAL